MERIYEIVREIIARKGKAQIKPSAAFWVDIYNARPQSMTAEQMNRELNELVQNTRLKRVRGLNGDMYELNVSQKSGSN